MLKDIPLEFSNLIATPGIHHSEVGSKTNLLITNHWSQLLTKHDQHPWCTHPTWRSWQWLYWQPASAQKATTVLAEWHLIISVTKWDSRHNSAEPCHLYCVNICTVIGKHWDSLLYGFRKNAQYILHFSDHQAVLEFDQLHYFTKKNSTKSVFWISLSCVHICTKIFVDFFEPQQGLVPYEPVVARERSLFAHESD